MPEAKEDHNNIELASTQLVSGVSGVCSLSFARSFFRLQYAVKDLVVKKITETTFNVTIV